MYGYLNYLSLEYDSSRTPILLEYELLHGNFKVTCTLGIFKVHASNINKILSFYLKLDLLLMFAFAIDDVNLSKYPTTFSLSLDSIYKLQKKVLECIEKLPQAGIKFCVLTVTKWIAINIGRCSLRIPRQDSDDDDEPDYLLQSEHLKKFLFYGDNVRRKAVVETCADEHVQKRTVLHGCCCVIG
ncbi:hypothetical protein TRIUR3_28687 [Triticum urartu]|uniref:Uncharacterized protein n=1 Tax=Triticum urartu TaxID=4572 RepID=M7ZHA7_TRIUA|nr:hypothetical protein TRIUR3_28687 [Triticum urartu]